MEANTLNLNNADEIKNPYKNSFNLSKKFAGWAQRILVFSFLVSTLGFIIKYHVEKLRYLNDYLLGLNCILIIVFAVLILLKEFAFYEASKQKRMDFIDNSFDTSFSDEKSINYYTNDQINHGILKMAVNGYENSFFTFKISKKMLKPLWIYNIIFALIFTFLAFSGYNKELIFVLSLTLPVFLIQQAIKHTLFVNRIEKVYEHYRKIFNDLKLESDKSKKYPEIIITLLDYETLLSLGCILTSVMIHYKPYYIIYKDHKSKQKA